MTIFAHLESGQAVILKEDVRQLLPYDVEYDDFSALTAGDFAYRYSQSKVEVISEMRCPVWFAVAPKTRKKQQYWKLAQANGEIAYALPDEIFCLARVGHGTHNFDRWVHLDFICEDGDLSNSDRNRLQKHPFSFLCPITEQWVGYSTIRGNFVLQTLPYKSNTGPRGIVDPDDMQLVMNMGHLNQWNSKFYKSKHGIGYLVSPTTKPEYSISKKLNATAWEYSGEKWPETFQVGESPFYYIPLSYFEPYGIPVSELDPKTIHILNWTVTGCDDLIRANL